MKQLIATLIMILCIKSVFADCKDETGIGTSIDIGTVVAKWKGDRIMSTDLGIWYDFCIPGGKITPYGRIKTWYVQSGTSVSSFWRGRPFLDVYLVGIYSEWKGIGLDLSHYCAHDVWSYRSQWYKYNEAWGYDHENGEISNLGHNSTTVTPSYTLRIAGLELKAAIGKETEAGYKFFSGDISYKLILSDITLGIAANHSRWSDHRNVTRYSGSVEFHGIVLKAEHLKANRQISRELSVADSFYDESPLVKQYTFVSIGYRFN